MRSPLLLALALALVAAAAPLLAACSSPTPLSLIITAGQETDAFMACGVSTVDVKVTSLDDTINLTENGVPVGGSFDFGTIDGSEQVTVLVTGFDASGAVVMSGSSLAGILLQTVQTGIPVFVECVNQWARPSGGLPQSHVNGNAFVEVERYLVLTGGTAATEQTSPDPTELDAYDVATLGGASTAAFDIVPETAVSLGQTMLIINGTGATWVDFEAETQTAATAPTGALSFSFADVAGGQVVPAPNDSAGTSRWFVVGGTRLGAATNSVLEVDGDQTLIAYSTAAAREGAAAAWVDNVGLVVAGGSEKAPGVEILLDSAMGFTGTSYPADPTVGAGGVYDGMTGMLLFGGVSGETRCLSRRPGGRANCLSNAAPVRWLEAPSCSSADCAPTPEPGLALPVGLTNVSAYAVGGGNSIVVGSEIAAPYLDRTFYASFAASSVVELPLREPRLGATPLPTPVGSLAILGGEHPDGTPATNVELLFPTTTLPTTTSP